MRVDAERNRKRILESAIRAFASDGLTVPVAEMARRAGFGTGTVSRRFPTKEALYEAIVFERVGEIAEQAQRLRAELVPGDAFYAFVAYMVHQAAANRGLAEAIGGDGFDIEKAASRTVHDLDGIERTLLHDAQQAGRVRSDADTAEVKALIVGCLARERQPPDLNARRRMVEIIEVGLSRTNSGHMSASRPHHPRR